MAKVRCYLISMTKGNTYSVWGYTFKLGDKPIVVKDTEKNKPFIDWVKAHPNFKVDAEWMDSDETDDEETTGGSELEGPDDPDDEDEDEEPAEVVVPETPVSAGENVQAAAPEVRIKPAAVPPRAPRRPVKH